MGEATIALVREATTALAMRDLERFERLCHPDVELDWSRRLLDAEVLRGFGDLRRFFAEVDGIFEEVVFEEDEVIDLGDDVLVVSTARFVVGPAASRSRRTEQTSGRSVRGRSRAFASSSPRRTHSRISEGSPPTWAAPAAPRSSSFRLAPRTRTRASAP
jgi:ketosteroid isomerase-like protein